MHKLVTNNSHACSQAGRRGFESRLPLHLSSMICGRSGCCLVLLYSVCTPNTSWHSLIGDINVRNCRYQGDHNKGIMDADPEDVSHDHGALLANARTTKQWFVGGDGCCRDWLFSAIASVFRRHFETGRLIAGSTV